MTKNEVCLPIKGPFNYSFKNELKANKVNKFSLKIKVEIEKERMRKMKFSDLKSTLKQYEEYNLSTADFREIEKSINGKVDNYV